MLYQGINHVLLVVTDVERSAHFLISVLGLTRHERISRWFYAGKCTIHLFPTLDSSPDESAYRQLQHVALQCDDLAATFRRLRHAGATPFQLEVTGQVKPLVDEAQIASGSGSFFVRDPDNNLFEFMQIGKGMFAGEQDPFSANRPEHAAVAGP